ncbi:MAG: DUF1015 family protein [Ignavibacteriaceae bacterium]|nr:DUF1015 family protein [Ignavibacteriaceae bacterium]
MAVVKPFKALRPKQEYAHLVASVPYDVVNTEEARALAGDNPFTLLRVTRSEIEFGNGINPYGEEIYARAKKNLETISADAMLTEERDALYIYSLTMNGRTQTGIAATFSVDDYDNDVIKKHEKTRKEKEDDRTRHIITTGAQTGPVFLTYRGAKRVDQITAKITSELKPVYDFTAPDGVQHKVWIIPAELTSEVVEAIGGVDYLYIADGHHRAASASRTRAEMRSKNPAHTGKEEYNFFIAVLFPAGQLHIMPYNRVVTDLNGHEPDIFLKEIFENFTIEQNHVSTPDQKGRYCLYLGGKWYALSPRDNVKASLSLASSIGEKLDVSILQNTVLSPILGIEDPRTSKRIDFVGGIRGTEELEKLVDSGKFAAAFSLYPVTVDDLMAISDAGEIMPPKSTWFEPKLRDGLLVHLI